MFIDLTQIFNNRMPIFPGDSPAELVSIAEVAKDGTADHQVKTGMHVGTHMDAPGHMIEGGKGLYEYPVEKFFGRGVLVDARGQSLADVNLLSGTDIKAGDIILVMFGWSEKFNDPDYYEKYPELTEAFANKLVELGVSIVGMDTPSPDKPPFKVHKILLPYDILIIENLTNLQALVNYTKFDIIALPVKFQAEASPCRVVAKVT